MIIINEEKFVEELIENKDKDSISMGKAMFLIAKKLRVNHIEWKDMIEELSNTIGEIYGDDYYLYQHKLMKTMQNICKKVFLEELELDRRNSLIVNDKDLETIKSFPIKYRKILFTILVLSKYNNGGWINTSRSDIFKLSNSSMTKHKQNEVFRYFLESGIMEISRKVDNLSFKIIDDGQNGEKVFEVFEMKNLGNKYMSNFEENYIMCEVCDKLVKRKSRSNTKYCKPCSEQKKRESSKKYKESNKFAN